MKKRSKILALFSLVFLLSLFLVACGNGEEDGNEPTTDEPATEETTGDNGTGEDNGDVTGAILPPHIEDLLNTSMPATDEMVEGGILRFARVMPTPFEGILHSLWANSANDSNIHEFFAGAIISTDQDFLLELGDDARGAAIPEISEDGLTITFTIRDGVYWHDGEPVTARDWLFTYEIMGSPEYLAAGGQRFGQQGERSIVGMMDFHEGNADYIAGIEVISERVLSITYEEVMPLRTTYFPRPTPYHLFADIPIDEMETHPLVRTDAAVGFGPFILDTIVPGESVTFTRNDNYWRGAPVLDGVEFRVVHPNVIGEEMAAGTVDIAHTFEEGAFPYFSDLSNVTFLKDVAFVYNYVGFRLGYWRAVYDEDGEVIGGESVLDPDATMADVNLRQAMWMAVDGDLIAEAWFNGLRWDAESLVPPAFNLFHDPTVSRPPYGLDGANDLLDDAGFAIVEGYRANPDGTPLEINFFGGVAGDSVAQAFHHYLLEQWRSLGLNVIPHFDLEFNAYNDLFNVNVDYDGIDVFTGAWSTGTNPSPYGLYGRTAAFNRSRYVSERNDALLARIDSAQAALDPEYRAAAFSEWQAYMAENASLFPFLYRFAFIPVNNRVVNYRINGTHTAADGWHLVGFTSETPYVD
ncbi:MAG: ABC transporter substrate-binding protein [Defluviitaleaceae bacterium]|nr:ABC transporter substrate-binding protein [Defluviitaleaceae bacterium]